MTSSLKKGTLYDLSSHSPSASHREELAQYLLIKYSSVSEDKIVLMKCLFTIYIHPRNSV